VRAPYYEQGYVVNPILKYYSRRDRAAENEYVDKVAPEVVGFLEKRKYCAFYVGVVHVGYKRSTSVPCVVLIAKEFHTEDAKAVISTFEGLKCKELKSLFCFEGTTNSSISDSLGNLTAHQTTPEIGSSIGVFGEKGSFSIGLYAHFADDEDNDYVLTVHHGISNEINPTTPSTLPEILVQQPSQKDFNSKRDEYLESLSNVKDGPTLRTPYRAEYYEKMIDRMDNLNLQYGKVHFSEVVVVEYEGRRIWSDWAVVKIKRDSLKCDNMNYIKFPHDDSGETFHPRDKTRVYITGTTSDCTGAVVVKRGRVSGSTKGVIRFVYDHVRIEGSGETTTELTIVDKVGDRRFSRKGDSGAPVVDKAGRVVGIIIGGSTGAPIALKGHESLGLINVSYISPIDSILDRISQVTSKSLSIDTANLSELEQNGTEIIRGDFFHD
jgi:hypothetical protein